MILSCVAMLNGEVVKTMESDEGKQISDLSNFMFTINPWLYLGKVDEVHIIRHEPEE